VTDSWVPHDGTPLKAGQRLSRQLGNGSHPVAASPNTFVVALKQQILPGSDEIVRLSLFDNLGGEFATRIVSEGTWPADDSDPVVAVLPSGDVLAAFTEFGGDGDGLGIAVRRLRAGQYTMDAVRYVSEPSFAAQQDADIIATSDSVVIAYTDESNSSTVPEIRVREFDHELNAKRSWTISDGANVTGRVSLAPLDQGWGAAFRTVVNNGQEVVVVYDAKSNVKWSTKPHYAGPTNESPALIPLGPYHRLVVFGVGTDPDGDGIFSTGQLQYAFLDTRTPNAPLKEDAVGHNESSGYVASKTSGESRPSLVQTGTDVYLAWQNGATSGTANGEDVWLQRISARITDAQIEITFNPEYRLPRWPSESSKDQRRPALALLGQSAHNPSFALASVWEDYGKTLGADSGEPDVLVQLAPLNIRRDTTQATDCTAAAPCAAGKARCTENNQCASGLVCSTVVGPNFDLAPGVGVCVAADCVANNKPVCGKAGCGTCACGDGIFAPSLGEACDTAGNSKDCDGDCTLAVCGDGFTNNAANELCDPGTVGGLTQYCDYDCTPPICGDKIVNGLFGEFCEPDVAGVDQKKCDGDCSEVICGDGRRNLAANEQCDPGSVGAFTVNCDKDCTVPECGDGLVNVPKGEACDPGTIGADSATCDKDCTIASCGDGYANGARGEECDLGTSGNTGVDCTADCKLPPMYTPMGAYVVEGDLVLPTKTDLSEFFASNSLTGPSDGKRTNGNVQSWNPSSRLELWYCVSNSTLGNSYVPVANAMAVATTYWEQVANVHFDYLPDHNGNCTRYNNNVFFNVIGDSSMAYNALSFFPEYGRGERQIILNPERLASFTGKSLVGILVHELGHALGFTHDHVNCESAMVPLPGTSTVCPSSASTDYVISPRDTWLASSIYGSITFQSRKLFGLSTGRTYGDWDFMFYSGTATPGAAIVGVSQDLTNATTNAILTYQGSKNEFTGDQAAVMTHVNAEVRRARRIDDWDWGYYHLECGLGEYMSGISQEAFTSTYRAHGFRCSNTTVPGGFTENCELRIIPGSSRGMTYSGDWDPGRDKAECSAGKVVVGASVFTDWDPDVLRRGHLRSLLCCGSSSRKPVAHDFEQRDAGFLTYDLWAGSSNRMARCVPGYGATGFSVTTANTTSSALLCSSSTNGQFSEGTSVTLANTTGDQRRYARAGDWDSGWVKLECGANEYITGIGQTNATPNYISGIRCTAGNLANQGLNNCETHVISSADDRGSTTSGDWSPSRRKLECSAGKVMVGLSTLWVYDGNPNARGKPHKILCCDR
jgi:hypothetical protein